MDADAVRNKQPSRTHPDRVRNALLAAVVFELAVLAGTTANTSGDLELVVVAGLAVSFVLGLFGFAAFLYYLVTL
ncbi:hypothetical protein [Halobacterium wangiae]|uniref:hypothetical protein n=1 Tax=Halobacterium wangiae TaxID=2902623 RepID=UPI001E2859C7|nr:hypothetical protein [Halobacterium wangiae]